MLSLSAISRTQVPGRENNGPDNQQISINKNQTIQVACKIFEKLQGELHGLVDTKFLPEDIQLTSNEPKPVKWLEKTNPHQERLRIETPSFNSVLRLCYLATFTDEVNAKVPFAFEDSQAIIVSNETRGRTYTWFKKGAALFVFLSFAQGFVSCMFPSEKPRDSGSIWQGLVSGACSSVMAIGGIVFTGIFPDVSQDMLNDKVDKLNKSQEKWDEVARTLIMFCFNRKANIRELAWQAANDIKIDALIKASTNGSYSLPTTEIVPRLKLLKQAVDYILIGSVPEDHSLNILIQDLLERKSVLTESGQWEEMVEE